MEHKACPCPLNHLTPLFPRNQRSAECDQGPLGASSCAGQRQRFCKTAWNQRGWKAVLCCTDAPSGSVLSAEVGFPAGDTWQLGSSWPVSVAAAGGCAHDLQGLIFANLSVPSPSSHCSCGRGVLVLWATPVEYSTPGVSTPRYPPPMEL